jgi:hypothetical protein
MAAREMPLLPVLSRDKEHIRQHAQPGDHHRTLAETGQVLSGEPRCLPFGFRKAGTEVPPQYKQVGWKPTVRRQPAGLLCTEPGTSVPRQAVSRIRVRERSVRRDMGCLL